MSESTSELTPPVQVLFVCLGNKCRSPTAHGVFETMVRTQRLDHRITVRSGGTGNWHVGESPDLRSQAHARKRGDELSHLRATQVRGPDFARADLVLAMDRENLRTVQQLSAPADLAKAGLFLDFAPDLPTREVPDPYYGGADGFERVLDLVEVASRSLLSHLRKTRGI